MIIQPDSPRIKTNESASSHNESKISKETGLDNSEGSRGHSEEERLQYLAMVQSIIERMANCSFSIKAGCIALLAGVIALEAQLAEQGFPKQVASAAIVCALFSYFDARYLQQERKYRSLFKQIVYKEKYNKELTMTAESKDDNSCLWQCWLSWSVGGFYAAILMVTVSVMII